MSKILDEITIEEILLSSDAGREELKLKVLNHTDDEICDFIIHVVDNIVRFDDNNEIVDDPDNKIIIEFINYYNIRIKIEQALHLYDDDSDILLKLEGCNCDIVNISDTEIEKLNYVILSTFTTIDILHFIAYVMDNFIGVDDDIDNEHDKICINFFIKNIKYNNYYDLYCKLIKTLS